MTPLQSVFFFIGVCVTVSFVIEFIVLVVRIAWALYRKPWLD